MDYMDAADHLATHGNFERFPVNAYEAESRRLARFFPFGHSMGKTVTPPVGLDQVFPTVLNVIGAGDGKSDLLDREAPPRQIYSESYYPRLHFGWSELRSLVTGERHFIDAPSRELYDYIRDPAELRNLANAERRTVQMGMSHPMPAAPPRPVPV